MCLLVEEEAIIGRSSGCFGSNLTSIDVPAKRASLSVTLDAVDAVAVDETTAADSF